MKLTPTRIKPLSLGSLGPGVWSYFDTSDCEGRQPARVGPLYKTKMEALADLDRYARDAGWTS